MTDEAIQAQLDEIVDKTPAILNLIDTTDSDGWAIDAWERNEDIIEFVLRGEAKHTEVVCDRIKGTAKIENDILVFVGAQAD